MTTTSRLMKRARLVDLRGLDVAAAAVLATFAVGVEVARHVGAVPVVALLVCAATVAWRRRASAAACLIALAGVAVFQHAGGTRHLQIVTIVVALDYYMLGRHTGERGWGPSAVLLLTVPVAVIATGPEGSNVGGVLTAALLGCCRSAPGGQLPGGVLAHELRINNERLAREHRERVRLAAGEELTRVARELHDIVAHNVSVMVIQAVVARRVAGQDREVAREALRSVGSCGREALSEMRRMMGVLHRDEIEPAGERPGLSQPETLA
ncbi:MAG: sensor histidine kinase [Solirubrobacteraceae bacterium]